MNFDILLNGYGTASMSNGTASGYSYGNGYGSGYGLGITWNFEGGNADGHKGDDVYD